MNNCEKCLNTRLIVSENGYHHICTLSARAAKNCLLGKKDRFIPVNQFQIGDWVYASDWCYGQIVAIEDNLISVEFDTGTGGGTWTFEADEVKLAEED